MKPMRQVEPLETILGDSRRIWWEKVEPDDPEPLPKPPVASGSTQGQFTRELSFLTVVAMDHLPKTFGDDSSIVVQRSPSGVLPSVVGHGRGM